MRSVSVKLLRSEKSGHSKRSDRPTVKNTDHGDYGIGWTCMLNVASTGMFTILAFIVNLDDNHAKMNVIAKISCHFAAVSLH